MRIAFTYLQDVNERIVIMKKEKKIMIIFNLLLFLWFFLDMTGLSIFGNTLVSRSYKEDGIFFLIYLVLLLGFLINEKIGLYILTLWLFLWFMTQFLSHWYFTIFGPWEKKRQYFSETIKLFQTKEVYIPDIYHIVLHVLILLALIGCIRYFICGKKKI